MKIRTLSTTVTLALLSSLAVADDVMPLVAIPGFADRTGDHATRVAPGVYKEKNVKVGNDSSSELSDADGKRTEKSSSRDVYEKQLERDIEFAPGDWKLPSQASLVAADAVASVLQSSQKFRILDRSTAGLKSIDNERTFAMTSSGNEGLLKICREKNAQFLVVGAISGFRIDNREGVAYGVKRRLYSTRVTMDIRVVDVESTEIVYQGNPSKTVNIQLPEGVTGFTEIYDWESVLRQAVSDASKDIVKSLAVSTGAVSPPEDTVIIKLTSTPPGADILIDGDFSGNTPAELSVPARRFRLKVQRQGHQSWEQDVMPREGMNISPTLELAPPAPTPSVTE